jgi:glycosyltransferase involved in cell wall biosynthesis
MKINFVSYLNPYKYHGGGEVVNRQLIEAGKLRGHEFFFTFARNRENNYNKSADIDILADVFNFPGTLKSRGAWVSLPNSLIEYVTNNRPFMHLNHAYADICNLGYLPCSGNNSEICPHKSLLQVKRNVTSLDFSTKCYSTNTQIQDAFLKSIANIFVSPLHSQIISKTMNIPDEHKKIIIRPLIKTRDFTNQNKTRDIENLFVGVISEAKGFYEMREKYSHKEIVLVGKIHPGIKLDFGTYLGELSYDQIPQIMNRAKNFVFFPRWPEPQGRVVVEAALSGCKLITNENVGALSFPFDIADPKNVEDSANLFWDDFEDAVR